MKELVITRKDLLTDKKVYYTIWFNNDLEDSVLSALILLVNEKSETASVLFSDFPEIEYTLSKELSFDIEEKFKELNIYDDDSKGFLLLKVVQSIDKSLIEYSN